MTIIVGHVSDGYKVLACESTTEMKRSGSSNSSADSNTPDAEATTLVRRRDESHMTRTVLDIVVGVMPRGSFSLTLCRACFFKHGNIFPISPLRSTTICNSYVAAHKYSVAAHNRSDATDRRIIKSPHRGTPSVVQR